MGVHASQMGSAMACQSQEGPRAQDTAEAGRRRVRHVMMLQLPALHEHTGILSLPVRMQVRERVLSLRLRRDVLNFLLVFCTPADVGHLAGIDRSVYEFCEVDAIWSMMLASDFWTSPMPELALPCTRPALTLDGIMLRHIHRLNGDVLGKARQSESYVSSKRRLIQRWHSEVDLRKKKALREQIQQLERERDVSLAECRLRWNSVIRRRRIVAGSAWMVLLLWGLRFSAAFWLVHAVRYVALHAYHLFYNMSWLFLQLAPGGIIESICIGAARTSRRRRCSGRDAGLSLLEVYLKYARRSSLLCLCGYIAFNDGTGSRRWHNVVAFCCMFGAGWGAFAAAAVFASLLLTGFLACAYFSLWWARCWTREFAAVAQRDQQELSITEDYQSKIRKCRVALGLPPDDRKSSCNCCVL